MKRYETKIICEWYIKKHDTKTCKTKMNDFHMKCVICEKKYAVWSDVCAIKKKNKKNKNKHDENDEIVFHFHKHT